MIFYDYFENIILEQLEKRNTVSKVIDEIDKASENRQIAFYPSGIVSTKILKEIKKNYSRLLPKIVGCFDRSIEATTEEGISVYNINEFDNFKNDISLLVIASNTFYSKDVDQLKESITYGGSILKVSNFDISLPDDLTNDEILSKIKKVHNLLADSKSKSTHMIAWLSRMLNDKGLTHLFESEEEINEDKEPLIYKGSMIKGLDHTCKKELQIEIYRIKHVFPKKGDVVFDLGAYKGDTSIFFAHYIGKNGMIYAFEPVLANFECLKKNIKNNGLEDFIIPINKGISDKPGRLKIVSTEFGAPWSFLSDQRGKDVEVTTIDSFVDSNNIPNVDFIKMDVEGFEQRAISGAKKTIKKFNPELAIALYHNTSDLFNLPLLLDEISNGNYKLYMRSKMEGPFGFTLFAKKK